MEPTQPFPALVSAENSRSASPASAQGSAGSASPPSSKKGTAKARHGNRRQQSRNKAAKSSGGNPGAQESGRASPSSSNGRGWKKGVKPKPQRAKLADASSQSGGSETGRPSGRSPRRSKKSPKNVTAPQGMQDSESASSSPASSSQQAEAPQGPVMPMLPGRGEAVGTLPTPMIITGEDGRARVVFDTQTENTYAHQPRRSTLDNHLGHMPARGWTGTYGGHLGLGAGMPTHAAARVGGRSVTTSAAEHAGSSGAPSSFRNRSMTSTQLRATARPFAPQHTVPQRRSLSSAVDGLAVPLSTPATSGARGRSQSASTHVSMTGLRISMAQSQPGNVMAPHLPMAARGGHLALASAYSSGGYFASRRASVSNVGLAVDPSHSIRIPTVMFQRQKPDVPPPIPAANTSLPTPTSASAPDSTGAEPEPAETSGESLAMRRLQEMIASMRAMGPSKPAQDHQDATPPASASAPPPAAAHLPPVMPPTPATHPSSRFDSILEEDEDTEQDEAILDADDCSASAHTMGPRAKSAALYAL
ncbi:hypothetical protein COEREDRAFT_92541 [Coemansia reversa NRRL 1564]|uniref:Uncharacterized protein n=1 Tax=Coemansia reversa (strain ATCC 12441 / NRRL 1564) TaxID=763665 RepID=A0A2G5BC28_COERN|nr:hypothetical protein COEREDRAFT_92541 [Coemansia reversa NRRL 1564]|eukprot:PIA16552.1 hypothetical protein COEREDRAFT_92541 [Coemansia reversa NRRL 1564]